MLLRRLWSVQSSPPASVWALLRPLRDGLVIRWRSPRVETRPWSSQRQYATTRILPAELPIKDRDAVLAHFKSALTFPAATCTVDQLLCSGLIRTDEKVVLHGYLGSRRVANKRLVFAVLHDKELSLDVQLVSTATEGIDGINTQILQTLADHSPVAIKGIVRPRRAKKSDQGSSSVTNMEIELQEIFPLNTLPGDLIITHDTVFPPEQRHLQIRHDKTIREALQFRSKVTRFLRQHLADEHKFVDVETPLLFKSTPEGAREFLVPTRTPGMAYALPQSPQQYKQILMASGIARYMQIAKCFRDEDLRADRQPEFTQVDLEMAFATGEDVMRTVEETILALWLNILNQDLPKPFPRLKYEEAMSKYGSDKPDTRLGAEIRRVEYMLPVDLVTKIGPFSDPIVEVFKMPIAQDSHTTRNFITTFMDSPDARPFLDNPDGQPGIFIIDSCKPLQGLQPFGFEAAEQLEDLLSLEDGDLLILQARKNTPHSGGSTPLGNLRLALHKAAVKQGLLSAPSGFSFLWITDFPLFSPIDTTSTEPGQGGSAGLKSTHHPFTAPKTPADVDLLLSDPLSAKADHYDLVVNGVELGGGSRRIHHAAVQELVLRDVLGMPDARVKDFKHLLEVLRAGCPPHAGLALGLDRLVAIMLGRESVRDVIAFPKSGKGEDALVGSPGKVTEEQARVYGLRDVDVKG